jgi:hypothetical protein
VSGSLGVTFDQPTVQTFLEIGAGCSPSSELLVGRHQEAVVALLLCVNGKRLVYKFFLDSHLGLLSPISGSSALGTMPVALAHVPVAPSQLSLSQMTAALEHGVKVQRLEVRGSAKDNPGASSSAQLNETMIQPLPKRFERAPCPPPGTRKKRSLPDPSASVLEAMAASTAGQGFVPAVGWQGTAMTKGAYSDSGKVTRQASSAAARRSSTATPATAAASTKDTSASCQGKAAAAKATFLEKAANMQHEGKAATKTEASSSSGPATERRGEEISGKTSTGHLVEASGKCSLRQFPDRSGKTAARGGTGRQRSGKPAAHLLTAEQPRMGRQQAVISKGDGIMEVQGGKPLKGVNIQKGKGEVLRASAGARKTATSARRERPSKVGQKGSCEVHPKPCSGLSLEQLEAALQGRAV